MSNLGRRTRSRQCRRIAFHLSAAFRIDDIPKALIQASFGLQLTPAQTDRRMTQLGDRGASSALIHTTTFRFRSS
jgi:hypothetical protein